MTLTDLIANIDTQNEEAMIFAKRVDEKFLPTSEAVLITVDDDEIDESTKDIADAHCPGFEYFLEVFLVKDLVEEFRNTVGYKSLDQQVDRIIQYAELDA